MWFGDKPFYWQPTAGPLKKSCFEMEIYGNQEFVCS